MAEKFWTEEEVVELTNSKFGGDREKAEFWIIDHDGWLPDEDKEAVKGAIKEATKGAVSDKKRGPKKGSKRDKDPEKVALIADIANLLASYEPTIANEQKELTFVYNGSNYSLSLTRHRG